MTLPPDPSLGRLLPQDADPEDPDPTFPQASRPSGRSTLSATVDFKLIYPVTAEWRKYLEGEYGPMNSQNKGFDPEHITGRVREHGRVTIIDGATLAQEEISNLYAEAATALHEAGNRYQIRTVFGSNAYGGGPELGTNVPCLIVLGSHGPSDVYPHKLRDGTFQTIRDFVDSF